MVNYFWHCNDFIFEFFTFVKQTRTSEIFINNDASSAIDAYLSLVFSAGSDTSDDFFANLNDSFSENPNGNLFPVLNELGCLYFDALLKTYDYFSRTEQIWILESGAQPYFYDAKIMFETAMNSDTPVLLTNKWKTFIVSYQPSRFVTIYGGNNEDVEEQINFVMENPQDFNFINYVPEEG